MKGRIRIMAEFILKLSAEDIAVIDMGLQEVKLRLAGPLVQKINAQIQPQLPKPVGSEVPKDDPRPS